MSPDSLWSGLLHLATAMVATDTPSLPALGLTQLWLHVGWGMVLAWLGCVLVGWWQPHRAAFLTVAAVLLASMWLPDPWSPAYWLGLAFQQPSLVLVLLSTRLLLRCLRKPAPPWATRRAPQPTRGLAPLAFVGVLLGWALLLDSFALLSLPVSLYALGFSPLAVALVAWVSLGLVLSSTQVGSRPVAWAVPLAVVAFVALRLPTGNVWDAVLDPWLWLGLHGYLVRVVLRRY
ncbi:hypothetical protein [Rhodoferax saidenbachensis]|uniref:ComEC/Rec2-related protein domain-containing protein n=1 Tax=Rhodoferax saidenbachensis TaxID=1484693 RepID=A0ABU1ZJM6_9BURK|nr:hypothetical protein [Rhodoferax saidenbachensis]MDR7305749.1 hypothetical protein [Rhodoferax saidenbachensis]